MDTQLGTGEAGLGCSILCSVGMSLNVIGGVIDLLLFIDTQLGAGEAGLILKCMW